LSAVGTLGGKLGRHGHRAPTEDFEITETPALRKAVGAGVLAVARIDPLSAEHMRTPPLAGVGRCRRLAERVDFLFPRRRRSR
jgi:hypothetical protein